MVKLYIEQPDKKRFEKLFKFLFQNNCELTLFPEGLKYRNADCSGVIYKEAFVEYNFTQRYKLGFFSVNSKHLNNWFDKWKDKIICDKLLTEIPVKS